MYSKLGTIVALLLGAFPFFALGYKVFEDSLKAGVVYGAIVLLLAISLFIASRIDISLAATPDTAPAGPAPREPAPPITWSWDGVDRQPEGQDITTEDSEADRR
jgi:hypothetical protein